MKVIGKVFKTELYKDKKGVEQNRITLIDEEPEGYAQPQFFNFVDAGHTYEYGQYVEFRGRILSGNNGSSFFAVDKESVKFLKN